MISRAPFGTRGSRLLSFFNWLTQLGFETEGLILIVGAGLVLSQMAGVHTSSGLKVTYIILAAAIPGRYGRTSATRRWSRSFGH